MCTSRIQRFCWCLDHARLARPEPDKESIVKVARWLMKLPIKQRRSRWVRVVIIQSHRRLSLMEKFRSSSCPPFCWSPTVVVQGKGHRSDGSADQSLMTVVMPQPSWYLSFPIQSETHCIIQDEAPLPGMKKNRMKAYTCCLIGYTYRIPFCSSVTQFSLVICLHTKPFLIKNT